MKHRPEIERLDKLQSASEETVKTARSAYYPNLQGLRGL